MSKPVSRPRPESGTRTRFSFLRHPSVGGARSLNSPMCTAPMAAGSTPFRRKNENRVRAPDPGRSCRPQRATRIERRRAFISRPYVSDADVRSSPTGRDRLTTDRDPSTVGCSRPKTDTRSSRPTPVRRPSTAVHRPSTPIRRSTSARGRVPGPDSRSCGEMEYSLQPWVRCTLGSSGSVRPPLKDAARTRSGFGCPTPGAGVKLTSLVDPEAGTP